MTETDKLRPCGAICYKSYCYMFCELSRGKRRHTDICTKDICREDICSITWANESSMLVEINL